MGMPGVVTAAVGLGLYGASVVSLGGLGVAGGPVGGVTPGRW